MTEPSQAEVEAQVLETSRQLQRQLMVDAVDGKEIYRSVLALVQRLTAAAAARPAQADSLPALRQTIVDHTALTVRMRDRRRGRCRGLIGSRRYARPSHTTTDPDRLQQQHVRLRLDDAGLKVLERDYDWRDVPTVIVADM